MNGHICCIPSSNQDRLPPLVTKQAAAPRPVIPSEDCIIFRFTTVHENGAARAGACPGQSAPRGGPTIRSTPICTPLPRIVWQSLQS